MRSMGGVVVCAGSVRAASDEAFPRFESLRSDKVYMREGPSLQHPVKWVYRWKGLPVEVLGAYDVWRRVRDKDGIVGWIHVAMLSTD